MAATPMTINEAMKVLVQAAGDSTATAQGSDWVNLLVNKSTGAVKVRTDSDMAAVSADVSAAGHRFDPGVFIVTEESTAYRCYLPEYGISASTLATAVGVLVREGDRFLVIAKDEYDGTMNWATENVGSGYSYSSTRAVVITDHEGKTRTGKIIEALGENALAASWCAAYHPDSVASDHARFGVGKWFMPAAGDLWTIYSHLSAINHALSLIPNSMPIQRTVYWSSTEYSATYAWRLYLSNGYFTYAYRKADYSYRVRAVSAFM